MPDALPSTDGERLDGLRAGTIVPLIGPLTEATLHGLGEFDGVIARLAAAFDDKIVAREPAYGMSPAVADDYSDFYGPTFGLDDV